MPLSVTPCYASVMSTKTLVGTPDPEEDPPIPTDPLLMAPSLPQDDFTRVKEVRAPTGLHKRKDVMMMLNGMKSVDLEKVRQIEDEVLELRIRGVAFREIEKKLNITQSYRIYKRALDRSPSEALRRDALKLDGERLDALQQGMWEKAMTGDARAIEVMLKLLERRSKLYGYDFADLLGARHAEVEEAKVKLMAIALTRAMDKAELTPDIRKVITAEFLTELREIEAKPSEEDSAA